MERVGAAGAPVFADLHVPEVAKYRCRIREQVEAAALIGRVAGRADPARAGHAAVHGVAEGVRVHRRDHAHIESEDAASPPHLAAFVHEERQATEGGKDPRGIPSTEEPSRQGAPATPLPFPLPPTPLLQYTP